jgi:lysozyme
MIAQWEGFSSLPYRDIVGVWTDGYGNTHGVVPGVPVSEPEARVTLQRHADKFAQAVQDCIGVPIAPQHLTAFTSLTYNIGPTAFCRSSIVPKYKAGDFDAACRVIPQFNKVRKNGKLVPVKGLTNRRAQEFAVCTGESK